MGVLVLADVADGVATSAVAPTTRPMPVADFIAAVERVNEPRLRRVAGAAWRAERVGGWVTQESFGGAELLERAGAPTAPAQCTGAHRRSHISVTR